MYWQNEVEKTIISGLRMKKNEDEILVALGKKGFELSSIQFSYYKKKCVQKLKNRR